MKITRHIHYTQNPDACYRMELAFDPPLDVVSTIGKIEQFYPTLTPGAEGQSNKIERTANVLNKNGLLDIRETMGKGEILSIDIQPGFRLDQIVIAEENELQILGRDKGLCYHFIIGKVGMFLVTAKLIVDSDGFFQKLKFDLTDLAMRDYIVRRSLANTQESADIVSRIPDLMDSKEAAKHYTFSKSWFDKQRAARYIPVTKQKKMRREDIEAFLNKPERKR